MLKPQPIFIFFVTPHILRDAAQVDRHHQDIRDQFRPFGLEMVLGHPERVVASLVHALA
jgi:hypothetical protein